MCSCSNNTALAKLSAGWIWLTGHSLQTLLENLLHNSAPEFQPSLPHGTDHNTLRAKRARQLASGTHGRGDSENEAKIH